MRVNKAIEDGSFFETAGAACGVRARPPRASARPRLARRRPLAHRARAGAAAVRAREDLDPRVHRRPRRLADLGGARPGASCRSTGSRRSSAATTRWTATSAGSGRSAPTTRSSTASATHVDRRRSRRCSASYDAGVTDEFIEPIVVDGTPRLEPGDTAIFFNFRPDRGASADADAARRRLRRDDDDALRERPRHARRVRGAAPCRTRSPRCSSAHGLPPAARRRDGEVRPRHLLLQRRPRGGVAGRDAACSSRARATSPSYDLKPEMSADEVADRVVGEVGERLRVLRRQLREPRHGRAHGLDPGRRSRRSRRPTAASAASSTGSPSSAASASSRPTTATPRRCSRRTASARTPRTRRTRSRWSSRRPA